MGRKEKEYDFFEYKDSEECPSSSDHFIQSCGFCVPGIKFLFAPGHYRWDSSMVYIFLEEKNYLSDHHK